MELAEKLNALTPGHFAKKTLLVNSGAEAVENAVKIARSHTRRPAILCVEDAFHGRTMLGMSLTSKTHPYKHGFGPFLSDVYRIPYGRSPAARIGEPLSMSHEDVDSFSTTPSVVVAAESVAAVIIEPVLGEGGFVVPPAGFLPALVDICRRHGIVFIADEVQTGFGRTGELLACTHFGIEPDLILTAKSLGGGLPTCRRHWPCRNYGRADSWGHRWHFRWQSGFLRGSSGSHRRVCRRIAARACSLAR